MLKGRDLLQKIFRVLGKHVSGALGCVHPGADAETVNLSLHGCEQADLGDRYLSLGIPAFSILNKFQ